MAFNAIKAINSAQDFLNQNNPLTSEQEERFKKDGFLIPQTYSADGNGLPYSKVPLLKPGLSKRNIISWFIPEFGVVKMYVNPNRITYSNQKIIPKERTKGGYSLQYLGEDLTSLTIAGTTGSSGIEGINMLYEIYRAEQYAFDSIGLTLSANSSNGIADLAAKSVGALGGVVGQGIGGLLGQGFQNETAQAIGSGILQGVLGVNNASSPVNTISLAQLAFTVEMYYNGSVYRGFFEKFDYTEDAGNFPITYNMTFVATQKRGYRENYFPWSRSANKGPSQYDTPTSFDLNNIQ